MAQLEPGDTFLLGTDLVKDVGRLEAAYDDSAGVTAAFNRNVLHRLNRELDADFVPDRFEHVALFDTEREWIEMRLRSTVDQVVTIAGLDLTVRFAAGEEMRTEISAKFRPDGLTGELTVAGLRAARPVDRSRRATSPCRCRRPNRRSSAGGDSADAS